MRNFDLAPLLRTSVGFDDLFRLTESLANVQREPAYPPYNIVKLGEDDYRIEMAVAGFSRDELSIMVQENALTISAEAEQEDDSRFLHRGIAKRAFERTFRLADTVRVDGARFENGLLIIDLRRIVPDHKKPRVINIETSENDGAQAVPAVEDQAA